MKTGMKKKMSCVTIGLVDGLSLRIPCSSLILATRSSRRPTMSVNDVPREPELHGAVPVDNHARSAQLGVRR